MNVMLIHADQDFLGATADALLMQGVACDTFSSGNAALDVLRRRQDSYTMVIVDYMLGDVDGFRFALRVHALDAGIRVIVLSGNMMGEYQRDILRCKGMFILYRPLNMEMLSMILDKTKCRCMAERGSKRI
ncbi:MAG: response regulator [Desulfovibrionaceae bacterium]